MKFNIKYLKFFLFFLCLNFYSGLVFSAGSPYSGNTLCSISSWYSNASQEHFYLTTGQSVSSYDQKEGVRFVGWKSNTLFEPQVNAYMTPFARLYKWGVDHTYFTNDNDIMGALYGGYNGGGYIAEVVEVWVFHLMTPVQIRNRLPGLVPLYRWLNPNKGTHFYSVVDGEGTRAGLINQVQIGWALNPSYQTQDSNNCMERDVRQIDFTKYLPDKSKSKGITTQYSPLSGHCITIDSQGQNVQDWECGNPTNLISNQKFRITPAGQILSDNNTCLTATDVPTEPPPGNGKKVVAQPCDWNNRQNQTWIRTQVNLVKNRPDIVLLRSYINPSRCLDIFAWKSHGIIQTYSCHGQANQQWSMDGQYPPTTYLDRVPITGNSWNYLIDKGLMLNNTTLNDINAGKNSSNFLITYKALELGQVTPFQMPIGNNLQQILQSINNNNLILLNTPNSVGGLVGNSGGGLTNLDPLIQKQK